MRNWEKLSYCWTVAMLIWLSGAQAANWVGLWDLPLLGKGKAGRVSSRDYMKGKADAGLWLKNRVLPSPPVKLAFVPLLQSIPEIDGKVEESAWQTACKLADFVELTSLKGAELTKAYLGYKDQSLFIAFVCEEPRMDKVRTTWRLRNARVWEDESVEVFIDVNRDALDYHQFIINSEGSLFDLYNPVAEAFQSAWNSQTAHWATYRGENYWSVEFKVELTELGGRIVPNQAIALNLRRFRRTESEPQCLAWSATPSIEHHPIYFGYVIFR